MPAIESQTLPKRYHFLRSDADFYSSSGGLRSPGLLRMAPVDCLQQITHLTRRQWHHPIHGLRPDETPTVQAFGIQRKSEPIMPERLDQRSVASTEDVDVAGERISSQAFLHLQRQAPHAATHVGIPVAIQIRTPARRSRPHR